MAQVSSTTIPDCLSRRLLVQKEDPFVLTWLCDISDDVANSWATSVSSRSISYRQAMVFGTIFELLGAITVGARTAETIKNGIIPNEAFRGNAGVQMLAFTCALAAASSWVMWCTRHSAHVSSTYSLVSAVVCLSTSGQGPSSLVKIMWSIRLMLSPGWCRRRDGGRVKGPMGLE